MIRALILLALLPLAASAASLTVNPIRLDMAAGARATSLTVTNQADEPALLQATVYRWTHDGDGADVLAEASGADAPIVTPPLFQLPGRGASQVVRIGFRKAPPPGEERRWRIVVEEVPKPAPIPDGAAAPQALPVAVATRLRLSMPLLLAPAVVRKALAWSLVEATQGLVALSVENRGSVTERFDQIALTGADAEHPLATLSGPIYLFPAERRSFTLKPSSPVPKGALHLRLQGTAQPAAVELAQPGS